MRVEEPAADRRQRRHARTRAALVDAAWELAREVGLAGVSQRVLAQRMDLAQPSLYTYFASKNDLYDAMFASGNQDLVDRMERLQLPGEPVQALKTAARETLIFFTEDPVRYQLLFQRTLPGFEPSAESYAVAIRFYEWYRPIVFAAGVQNQTEMDIFVAFNAGMAEAQLANDPGGDRFIRHSDWLIDTFLAGLARRRPTDS